jgi:hypothetical protein
MVVPVWGSLVGRAGMVPAILLGRGVRSGGLRGFPVA